MHGATIKNMIQISATEREEFKPLKIGGWIKTLHFF
jgi:hypothetical protein